jgi:hypothetical protein
MLAASALALAAAPGELVVRSGGVGLEERAMLDATRDAYNLRLAFTDTRGEYLAGVTVRLTTATGETIYEARDQGPLLFLRVDPGDYRLELDYDGVAQERRLRVSERQAQRILAVQWPGGGGA